MLLDFLITAPLAQEAAGASSQSGFASLIPLALIMAVFYFLLIRPQQKKIKEQQAIIQSAGKGDEVVTIGGIFGQVVSVDAEEGIVQLQISENSRIKIRRESISEITKSVSVQKNPNADKAEAKTEDKKSKNKKA